MSQFARVRQCHDAVSPLLARIIVDSALRQNVCPEKDFDDTDDAGIGYNGELCWLVVFMEDSFWLGTSTCNVLGKRYADRKNLLSAACWATGCDPGR